MDGRSAYTARIGVHSRIAESSDIRAPRLIAQILKGNFNESSNQHSTSLRRDGLGVRDPVRLRLLPVQQQGLGTRACSGARRRNHQRCTGFTVVADAGVDPRGAERADGAVGVGAASIDDDVVARRAGQLVVARGPDAAKAPKDAVVVQVEILPLGGTQTYRRITIAKGQSFTAPANSDTLVNVLKGRMRLKLGAVDAEVGVGDAWRKIAVQTNVYTALEDTLLVETDAPLTK